jgi:hypothetical protein
METFRQDIMSKGIDYEEQEDPEIQNLLICLN